ncbi:insulinase family protein [Actinomadura sp. ATCC 31491]|uniref:Insulinase family protein n=1 Tax=Actinomadura luzonensis TaxID=2805427 RepID=A0ABT0FMZ4_9ACTN|nr:pitrilysin family protein [Actinomadura luzonensis]MCK2213716.1 insulinase family protein [Actinomadura luzonensis]
MITRVTLGNGLRVVIEEERSVPVAGVAVHYDVGFRAEAEHASGLAHLFEHLMFQGHFQQVERVGGICNASTRQDYTDFYTVVPSGSVAAVIALEAGRMRAPEITERAVRTQVSVIREEILGKTRRPYGGFPWPRISPVLFRSFANAHDGYGDHAALQHVTVADCAEFFERHYGPGDAVLTVAGDVEPEEVLALVERAFGGIPGRPRAARASYAEPEPAGQVTARHADPLAPLPALALGHRVPDPAAGPAAHVALSVLAGVLTGGVRSRLTERLHRDTGHDVTFSARTGLFDLLDARDPDLWLLTAIHPAALPAQRMLAAVDAELRALAAGGPTREELRRCRNAWSLSHHRSMDALADRVRMLGRFELLFGDPGLAARLPELYAAVDAEDVAAAARGLRPDSRALLTITPGRDR